MLRIQPSVYDDKILIFSKLQYYPSSQTYWHQTHLVVQSVLQLKNDDVSEADVLRVSVNSNDWNEVLSPEKKTMVQIQTFTNSLTLTSWNQKLT